VTCIIRGWALEKRFTVSLSKPRLHWLLAGVPLLWNSGMTHGLNVCRLFCLELFLWVRYSLFLVVLMLSSLSGWSDKHIPSLVVYDWTKLYTEGSIRMAFWNAQGLLHVYVDQMAVGNSQSCSMTSQHLWEAIWMK
jgi:hypothetical protein